MIHTVEDSFTTEKRVYIQPQAQYITPSNLVKIHQIPEEVQYTFVEPVSVLGDECRNRQHTQLSVPRYHYDKDRPIWLGKSNLQKEPYWIIDYDNELVKVCRSNISFPIHLLDTGLLQAMTENYPKIVQPALSTEVAYTVNTQHLFKYPNYKIETGVENIFCIYNFYSYIEKIEKI